MAIKRLLVGALLALQSFSAFAAASEYYTQHNLWMFKGSSAAANYAVNVLVPVNTKVAVLRESMGGGKLQLMLIDAKIKVTVVLADTKSQKPKSEIKARMLGDAPVDLTNFSKDAQVAIKRGEVRPGMTRAEVLVARGYPPEQTTLSLDSDAWTYRQSRWNSIIVHFDGDKVSDIKD